ncbi:MAG: hypothetical protein ACLPTJ_00390 [Solirubrobacteraceae bacterium]
MSLSPGKAFAVAVAAFAGPAVAVALAAGGGPELPPVTIGSTTGNPTGNSSSCASPIDCTYVPYSGASTPELLVPLDGTITSFAVNAGSSGTLELRILQPTSGGQLTAVATSPPEMATGGPQSFSVSIPVKAGDVLGVDNSSDQLLFDTTSGTSDTAWYYQPALADGATASFTGQMPYYRLLVSATILPNPTTTTTTTSGTTTTTISLPPPILSHVSQAHKTWRLGTKLATISSSNKSPPVGTTFKFDLNQAARVSFAFTQLFAGRKVKGKCVSQTSHNLHARKCTRYGRTRTMSFTARAGSDKVAFDGRVSRSTKLKTGSYRVAIQASAAGGRSNTVSLGFTIAG